MTRGTYRERPLERAADPAGFTLIEVMVSMVILAIGMLAVAAAQIHALQAAGESDNRAQAMYLADEQMARFMAMNGIAFAAIPAVVPPGTPIWTLEDANGIVLASATVDSTAAGMTGADTDMNQVADFTQFFRRWSVQANTPRTGLSTITVQVRWGDSTFDPLSYRQVQLIGVK